MSTIDTFYPFVDNRPAPQSDDGQSTADGQGVDDAAAGVNPSTSPSGEGMTPGTSSNAPHAVPFPPAPAGTPPQQQTPTYGQPQGQTASQTAFGTTDPRTGASTRADDDVALSDDQFSPLPHMPAGVSLAPSHGQRRRETPADPSSGMGTAPIAGAGSTAGSTAGARAGAGSGTRDGAGDGAGTHDRMTAADMYQAVADANAARVAREIDVISGGRLIKPAYPARIAVYDDMSMPPRVVVVEPKEIREYLQDILDSTYELMKQQGGDFSYQAIRELVENYIHASFIEPTISILDGGQTIVFSDQGPGIPNKEAAIKPSFTSATREMKQYIRGVGSGLPIVEEYIHSKGGTISIDDNLGHGTIITISLAHAVPPTPAYDQRHGLDQPGQGGQGQGQGQPGQTMSQAAAGTQATGPAGGAFGQNWGYGQPVIPYGSGQPMGYPQGYGQYPQAYPGYGQPTYQQPYQQFGQYGQIGQVPPTSQLGMGMGVGMGMGAVPQGAPGMPGYPQGYGQYPQRQGAYPQGYAQGYPPQPQPPQQPYPGVADAGVRGQQGAYPPYPNVGMPPSYGPAGAGTQAYGRQTTSMGSSPQQPAAAGQVGVPTAAEATSGDQRGADEAVEKPRDGQQAPRAARVPLDTEQGAIIGLFATCEKVGPAEIEEGLGITKPTASRRLLALAKIGYVFKSGQKYVLTEEGRLALERLQARDREHEQGQE